MGESPISTDIWFMAEVPHLLSISLYNRPSMAIWVGSMRMRAPSLPIMPPERNGIWNVAQRLHLRLRRWIASRSWGLMPRVPENTTALSFLAPITAPSPERAAMRPLSVQMPEIRERFSPAGPMQATRGSFFLRQRWVRRSSVSTASRPTDHRHHGAPPGRS